MTATAYSNLVLLGEIADRPAAGVAGRTFIATDQGNRGYRDNGATWDETTPTAAAVGGDAAYVPLTQKGANSGVATLDSAGKVPAGQLPALALTETYVVASEAAMLALSAAEVGDIALRSDTSTTWVLAAAGPSTLANWKQLLTPTDNVLSVDGRTGVVTLSDLYAAAAHTHSGTASVQAVFDGNGSTVGTTNSVVEIVMPYAATITGVTVLADASTSATFTVGKCAGASYPTFTSIVASAAPTLSSATRSVDTTLTGWTTSLSAGDVVRVTCATNSVAKRLVVSFALAV